MTLVCIDEHLVADAAVISDWRWNGFAVPSFTTEVGMKLVEQSAVAFAASGENGEDMGVLWDAEREQFYEQEWYEGEGPSYWPKREVDGVTLHDIGGGAWVWQEVSEHTLNDVIPIMRAVLHVVGDKSMPEPGGFLTRLIEAALRADQRNIARFKVGFPELGHVVDRYKNETGYVTVMNQWARA